MKRRDIRSFSGSRASNIAGPETGAACILAALMALWSCGVDEEPGSDEAGQSFYPLTDPANTSRIPVNPRDAFFIDPFVLGGAHARDVKPPALPVIPNRYIVVLDDKVVALRGTSDPAEVGRAHGLAPDITYRHAIRGFAVTIGDLKKLNALTGDAAVKYIQPDSVMYKQDQRLVPYGRDRVDADVSPLARIDGEYEGSGQSVDADVAIIDTGIDLDHGDLVVAGGKDFVWYNKLARDGTELDTEGDDLDGHGTHCAGIVGALDDGFNTGIPDHMRAITGVAPGARVWAVRVLDANGGGYVSEIIAGIDWIKGCVSGALSNEQCLGGGARNIRVANMSLGCQCGSPGCWCPWAPNPDALLASINAAVAAGVTFVVAAGNSAINVGTEASCGFSPACFDSVITVSALTDFDGKRGGQSPPGDCDRTSYTDDTLAPFSNYGAQVDMIAPGVCIDSTTRHSNTGYCTHCGAVLECPDGKAVCPRSGYYDCCKNSSCAQDCVRYNCPEWRTTICQAGSTPNIQYWCCYYDYDYTDMSGTSMASPHVAGGAALYIAEYKMNHGGASPSPSQVRSALTSSGDAAPCGGGGGTGCTSWAERGLFVGEHRDGIEVSGYSVDFMLENGDGYGQTTTSPIFEGSRSLAMGVHDENSGVHGYSCVKFCLSESALSDPLNDYLKAAMQVRFASHTDWTGFGISGLNGTQDVWQYWWWIKADGAVMDETLRFGGDPMFGTTAWHYVEIKADRAVQKVWLTIDDSDPEEIPMGAWYSGDDTNGAMRCLFVMSGITDDTYQDLYVDNVFLHARPEGQY